MASTVASAMDFWRLAEEAERRGITIMIEPISGQQFATSATDATRLYLITGLSCTCLGFQHWQRCTHHSLFLAQLGWLPDLDPTPGPPVALAVIHPSDEVNGAADAVMAAPTVIPIIAGSDRRAAEHLPDRNTA